MKTTLHTRIDTTQQDPNACVLIDRMMQQYGRTYRKAFAGVCRLAQKISEKELTGSLAKEAQKHLYPQLKQESRIQEQMHALLKAHLTQEQLEKSIDGNVLLDSWTSDYSQSILNKVLGIYKALGAASAVVLKNSKHSLKHKWCN